MTPSAISTMQHMSLKTIKAGNREPINNLEDGMKQKQKQKWQLNDEIPVQTIDPNKAILDGINVAARLLAVIAFIPASFFCYPIETLNYETRYETSAFIFIGAMIFFLLSNYLEIKTAKNLGEHIVGHTICAFGAFIVIIANIVKVLSNDNDNDNDNDNGALVDAGAYLWIVGSSILLFGHLAETIAATIYSESSVLANKLVPIFGLLGSLFFLLGSILSLEDLLYPDETDYYYYGWIWVFLSKLQENMTRQSALYLTGSSVYVLHGITYMIAKFGV